MSGAHQSFDPDYRFLFKDRIDFRDKPMMQFSSRLVNSGTETQMILTPSISYTTHDAIDTFSVEQRGCYANGEVNLTTLNWVDGYQYSMDNCLTDQASIDIMFNCRCYPRFFTPCSSCDTHYEEFLPSCSGPDLLCANTRMNSIGMKKTSVLAI